MALEVPFEATIQIYDNAASEPGSFDTPWDLVSVPPKLALPILLTPMVLSLDLRPSQ